MASPPTWNLSNTPAQPIQKPGARPGEGWFVKDIVAHHLDDGQANIGGKTDRPLEDVKGSLEVGKLADVTVLSRDILTVPEDEILEAEVLYTVVGGKLRYRAREITDR